MATEEYFGKSKNNKDGFRSECKKCVNEKSKERRKLIKEGKTGSPQKFIDLNLHYMGEENKLKPQKFHRKKVFCDNMIFNSVNKFAEYYKISHQSANDWLNGKTKIPQQYIDLGLKQYIEEDKENILKNKLN